MLSSTVRFSSTLFSSFLFFSRIFNVLCTSICDIHKFMLYEFFYVCFYFLCANFVVVCILLCFYVAITSPAIWNLIFYVVVTGNDVSSLGWCFSIVHDFVIKRKSIFWETDWQRDKECHWWWRACGNWYKRLCGFTDLTKY